MELPHCAQKRERSVDQDLESYSTESTFGNKRECILITHIRATDVAINLKRIPVGFYIAVRGGDVIKETSNKSAAVGKDVVEWGDEIILPLDQSPRLSLTVIASFELGPTLGEGEVICNFETTIGESLDPSGRLKLVKFWGQSDEEAVSLCSSLEIEIKRLVYDHGEYAATSNPEAEKMHQPGEFTDRGHHALIRYRELQEQQDLCTAVTHFERARDLCPPDHPNRAIVLFNLATAKLMNCRVNDVTSDLDAPINLYRDALHLRPLGHPDRPTTLLSLGVALEARFQRNGDEADELDGRTFLSQVLGVAPADSYVYHAAVLALGSTANSELIPSTVPRTLENDIDDDEDADDEDDVDDDGTIHRLDAALQWMFYPDSRKPALLDHLGILFCIRFDRLGDLADREKAISVLEVVLKSTSDNHPDKPSWMDYLGDSLSTRYMQSGNLDDLEKSISWRENALRVTPDSHPERPARLSDFGYSLLTRYERSGDDDDLKKSLSLFEDALESTPEGDPDRPSWLSNLAEGLLARYERFGNADDLQESISTFQAVVQSTHDDHPEKVSRLQNLSMALLERYRSLGNVDDLEMSISGKENAVELTPDDHLDKPSRLSSLANSLWARYERLGHVDDLEVSISMSDKAVRLTPNDHPDKSAWLNNLGGLWLARYARFGDVGDLETSISMKEDALSFAPNGHPDKPAWLSNLGGSLLARYQRLGNVADLERSISLSKDAVDLTPNDHPDKPAWLNNLGNCLAARFECFGDLEDLEKSIEVNEDAVRSPRDHLNKPSWLNNLGDSLLNRYERTGVVDHLERSISMFEEAEKSTADGHPDMPSRLNNLGRSLLIRYQRLENILDLQGSISKRESALQLTPDGHPDKHAWLNNLGGSLLTRYERLGNPKDLEESISMRENALELIPDGHPEKPLLLNSLTFSLLERFRRSGDVANPDLSLAISYSTQAARSPAGLSLDRFHACQLWAQSMRFLQCDPQSLLDPYKEAVNLLPQLAWIGLSLPDRYQQLLRAADETCDAAAAALEAQRPELAVEWLEQGRSIMWSQLSQLRTPVDDLRTTSPELADQFEHVSRQLERASSPARAKVEYFASPSHMADGLVEKQAEQYHSLALLRKQLLADIRDLPGFEQFLLPKTIDQLASLVHSGPVVFLNASKHRCDALIVKKGSERVVHVPLSSIDYDEVAGMQLRLNKLLRLHGRTIVHDDASRGARPQGLTPEEVFRSILPSLWHKVVDPVLNVLGLSTPDSSRSRIFWCPTGPFTFLPIHAAGIYDTANPGPKLSEFVISSYIPTMSALELPPQEDPKATSRSICLLTVPQPDTDGQPRLLNVPKEMEVIRNMVTPSPSVEVQDADGTVEDVFAKMKETDWVHFACHGTQDRAHPFNSGFLLADGKRLKLSDIARLSRPQGGLAFLSACHTATGDEELSEEAIHVAAGMLLAGYKSVIATMWAILDNVAPQVAGDIYKDLLVDAKAPDSRRAAEALHHAIEQLRDSGAPFLSWVPFIHVGL